MPTIAPGIDASVIARPIASSSRLAVGASSTAPAAVLDVTDSSGVTGTGDEHPASAIIAVPNTATTDRRIRDIESPADTKRV
jgi:hypothetical protein